LWSNAKRTNARLSKETCTEMKSPAGASQQPPARVESSNDQARLESGVTLRTVAPLNS
jgi:hypothetical protein